MKLDQLAYFVETARFESVGKASQAVGISPSAISTSVRALESELGCKLFVRRKQRIYLTDQGRALVPRATEILASVERLVQDLARPELVYERHYTLACARFLAATAVGPEWAMFHEAHTRLSAEILTLRSVEIVAKAAAGEIDLGICVDPTPHPEVDSRKLATHRYAVAVRRGHPLARVPRSSLTRALQRYPACMPRSFAGGGYEAHGGLERLGVRPRVELTYDSYDVVFPRLRRSDAWALCPPQTQKDIAFLALPRGEIPFVICAVWPQRRPLNPALEELVERLAARLS